MPIILDSGYDHVVFFLEFTEKAHFFSLKIFLGAFLNSMENAIILNAKKPTRQVPS